MHHTHTLQKPNLNHQSFPLAWQRRRDNETVARLLRNGGWHSGGTTENPEAPLLGGTNGRGVAGILPRTC